MMLKPDAAVAEIGSTTTVVSLFDRLDTGAPVFLGQGQAETTVLSGDVRAGLTAALHDAARKLAADAVEPREMFAASSAAGGLRTTVHGLVYDMTARAAREAALGAGAVIKLVTAGVLSGYDLDEIARIDPNLILLAGGTDFGERETALANAEKLAGLGLKAPVLYAGNMQNQSAVKDIFARAGIDCTLTDNVYPRLDELVVEPARRAIHTVFERHITEAPGMAHVREMVSGDILPTPGAVMECAMMAYELLGDVAVLDVGGATTDVHSVTEGSDELAAIALAPEPRAKRTVEGDLGVFVNARNVAQMIGFDRLKRETGLDIEEALARLLPVPDARQLPLTQSLTKYAAETALTRHAGKIRYTYGASGRKAHADGKDLTQVRALVATGGALTRLPGRAEILAYLNGRNETGELLLPRPGQMKVYEDRDYIMAALGVLRRRYPEAAATLLKRSLGI